MDLEEEILNQRNSLSTDRLDMSFGEIISMYQRNEIIIDPDFQRLFRWSDEQKTNFIESVILGIPIPPIFVAEDKEGKWELVDGLQRISSLLSFFGELRSLPEKNNWEMCEGGLVKSLSGINYNTLPSKLALNIKRATCRVEIIRWNSDYDMRYELFNRLNTGGTELTAQEIRNCVFRGISSNFNDFLKRVAAYPILQEMTGVSAKQVEELYLEELVLRFVSQFNVKVDDVEHDLHIYMTEYMKKVVKGGDFDEECGVALISVLHLLKPLGKEVFRLSNHNFSASLFDMICVGIAENFQKYSHANEDQIIEKINQLKGDKDLRKYIGSGAGTKHRVRHRLNLSRRIFS